MAILSDGRIKCNVCGWCGTEVELTGPLYGLERTCPTCWMDPHEPRGILNLEVTTMVIWKCNRCGFENVASCLWQTDGCEKCGCGAFTWLDLPEQLDLFQNGNCG